MKFKVISYALATGVWLAIISLVVTIWAMVYSGGGLVVNLKNFYFGYQLNFLGVILSIVYGFVYGFILGGIFSWLYNTFTGGE